MEINLETVTPETAAELLKNNNANRPLKEGHIMFLAREMKSGDWMTTPDPIKIGHHGNLLDGQHRLRAIVESGKTLNMYVARDVPNEQFKVLDTGKNRSKADVLAIAGFKEYNNISGICGFIWNHENFRYSEKHNMPASNTQILEFATANKALLSEIIKVAHKRNKAFSKILPIATIGGLDFIFRAIHEERAKTFIDKLCYGLDIQADSPILHLRNVLIRNSQKLEKLHRKDITAYVFIAWNHFRKGNTVKKLTWKPGLYKYPKPI